MQRGRKLINEGFRKLVGSATITGEQIMAGIKRLYKGYIVGGCHDRMENDS